LENYTKYKLKDADELVQVLADLDNIFVVSCNKCFKEFETVDEPDCEEFVKIATEQGKKITGTLKIDFLCNMVQTEKKLRDAIPAGTENIFVVSCGLGIQTIAKLVDVPVYAAANSINYTGHHGMALTKKACDACAQCYLNITAASVHRGLLKSLVNGSAAAPRTANVRLTATRTAPGRRSSSALPSWAVWRR
jgi:electron transport complex protein RnfC